MPDIATTEVNLRVKEQVTQWWHVRANVPNWVIAKGEAAIWDWIKGDGEVTNEFVDIADEQTTESYAAYEKMEVEK